MVSSIIWHWWNTCQLKLKLSIALQHDMRIDNRQLMSIYYYIILLSLELEWAYQFEINLPEY